MGSVEMLPPWRHEEDSGESSTLELKLKQVWLQTQLQKTGKQESMAASSSNSNSSSNNRESETPDLDSILSMLMNDDDMTSSKNEDNSSLRNLEQELRDLIGPNEAEEDAEDIPNEEFDNYEDENDAISGLFNQLSTGLSTQVSTCSFSTNVDFDNDDIEAEFAAPIETPEGAWMIESPFGLQWPKKFEEPTKSTSRGSYYQVLEGLGLKNLELVEELVECAKAVSIHDQAKANRLVAEIRNKVSPFGTSTQRLVHYFVEALVARMSATGNGIFTAMCYAKPRAAVMLKSVEFLMERSPLLTVRYFFPNQVILNVCKGYSRIHIVDYGTEFGFQWPSLMQELVKIHPRPQLRITGIDSPLPGAGMSIAEEVGCMLREYANSLGLTFKFRTVSMKWENIGPEALLLKDDEVLVVNCMFRQTNLLDESVLAESPRKMWLNRVRSLNPKVFLQGMNNASYNVPFFMTRFLEALTHYAIFFDAMDNCAAADSVERHKLEQEKLCREIVNVVACEGLERVQRAETYKQWHSRTQRARFELLPIDTSLYKDTESLMSLYHHDFCLQKDDGWLLLGWKGQILHVFSAWAPIVTR